jgi:hypothetical protein
MKNHPIFYLIRLSGSAARKRLEKRPWPDKSARGLDRTIRAERRHQDPMAGAPPQGGWSESIFSMFAY